MQCQATAEHPCQGLAVSATLDRVIDGALAESRRLREANAAYVAHIADRDATIAALRAELSEARSEPPRHLNIAIANATRAFERGDMGALATINEWIQPLVDAALLGLRGANWRLYLAGLYLSDLRYIPQDAKRLGCSFGFCDADGNQRPMNEATHVGWTVG